MNAWSLSYLCLKIGVVVGGFFACCSLVYGDVRCCSDMLCMGEVFAAIGFLYCLAHAVEEFKFASALAGSLSSGMGMMVPFMIVSGVWFFLS